MQKNHDWAKYYRYISDCAHRNGLMSSRALAEKADLSESVISKFKAGETKSPSFDTVYALCASAGASIDAMCGLKTEAASDLIQEIEKNKNLVQENHELQHKIEMLNIQLESISDKSDQLEERRAAIQRVAKMRLRFIVGLTIGLSAVLLLVIGILIYDKFNPDIGWFTAIQNTTNTLENLI